MLLRRVIEHVKAQNWIAVGLDFFIVIIGVFIAFQAAEWNTTRKDRGLEREYIGRLISDAAVDIANHGSALDRLAVKRASLERIGTALKAYDNDQTNDTLSGYGVQFFIDIRRSTNFGWYTGDVHSPTFDEMVSSGRLTLIKHPAMRRLITDYYARRRVQASRTQNRTTGYANLIYRFAPPRLMAIDQLAPDDEIVNVARTLDSPSVLAGFHEAGLDVYVNAELSFAYFLEREEGESRNTAHEFKAALQTYLDTDDVLSPSWGPIG